jgi:hypothetical protein
VNSGLVLTEGDRQSPAWTKLMRHLESRKRELQGKISGDLDTEQTWKMRGRIAEVEGLLSANTDAPLVESDFK